jgi:type II secretory pathway component PulK
MIMVVVTMMVIVMTVVMVGLIGRNFSFVLSTEEQLRHIEAEQVAKGAFWRAYQSLSHSVNPTDYNETVDGRQYHVTYTITEGVPTNQVDVRVDY